MSFRFTVSLLTFYFLISVAVSGQETKSQVAAVQAVVEQPNVALLMAFLKPSDVVLEVGELHLTWQEAQPQISRLTGQQAKEDAEQVVQKLRTYLQRLALRGLYLLEARARQIELSPEEKVHYEKQLEESLAGNRQGVSKEAFLKAFAPKESTLQKLTYEDSHKIVKLGDELMGEITVSQTELEQGLAIAKSIQASLRKQNESKRELIRKLLQDPGIRSDGGFAKLAREYSEGAEAPQGGELKLNFRRQDLAEVNGLEKFDLQPGETSGLYETETAFRVIRVLKSLPAEKPEDVERLRISQMLFKKLPVQEDLTKDRVKKLILVEKQKKAREQKGRSLQEKFPVKSIFFPNGLW